jgi:hypothetical protein
MTEYVHIITLNGKEIYKFITPIPLNEEQLCEFEFNVVAQYRNQDNNVQVYGGSL